MVISFGLAETWASLIFMTLSRIDPCLALRKTLAPVAGIRVCDVGKGGAPFGAAALLNRRKRIFALRNTLAVAGIRVVRRWVGPRRKAYKTIERIDFTNMQFRGVQDSLKIIIVQGDDLLGAHLL